MISIIRTAAVVLAAALMALPGIAAAQTTLEKIKKAGVMTAGNSGSYPPFEIMEGGKLVGEMSSQMAPETQKVTDITKKGDDLILKFQGNFQGQGFDATITLTPDGTDKCKVTFDVNSGMFTMSGAGTKGA